MVLRISLTSFFGASGSETSLLGTFHTRHTYTVHAFSSYSLPSVAQARRGQQSQEGEVVLEQASPPLVVLFHPCFLPGALLHLVL